MEEFYIILNQVIILFIILIIGYTAGKFKILDSAATKKLSEILLFIISPMMVLHSFFIEFSEERVINIFWVIGIGGFMFLVSILIAKFIYKGFSERIAPTLKFTAVLSNCGYIGLPILKALYGDDGAFYGSFYIVLFNVVLWSYGFMLFGGKGTKKQMIKKVLMNPSLIAVYLGLIIFFLRLPIPEPIAAAVNAVGNMTMPFSMLIIGGVISSAKLLSIFTDWRVYLSSGVRLILMPILALIFTRIANVPALPAAVVVVSLAMPSAVATTMFAEMFDKDAVFSSKCVAISTLFSIITVPLIILLMV